MGGPRLNNPEGVEVVGDLAIVLHSHMPYVEGYGTYPFGEEWLFDAVVRSHLPVAAVARNLTLTVTPVLADQLESPPVIERLRGFCDDHRVGAACLDREDVPAEYRAAVDLEISRYRRSLAALRHFDGPLDAFREAASARGVELIASAASHAVLPLLASNQGKRLQIDAGLRSHRRRFGACEGFWLPECAYDSGLESLLAEFGVERFCIDQTAVMADGDALRPIATAAGPVAMAIDWPTVDLVWSWEGYPSFRGYADFHRISGRGMRIFAIDGGPYDPAAAAQRAVEQADEFLAAVAARLARHREAAGEGGLIVFAADTELFGHWWSEGPVWLETVLARAGAAGIGLCTLSEAAAAHRAVERPLVRSSWGADKSLATWDSREVAEIAWAARRLELAVLRAAGAGAVSAAALQRAARELVMVQSSDWAFLDKTSQAGDYGFERATQHCEAAFEALRGNVASPRLRNLAPDLSLAPLISPAP